MRHCIRGFFCILLIFTLAIPVYAEDTAAGEPELTCPSALLMDFATGKILYEKNSHERRPLASVTKIMTMLLAMEAIDSGNLHYDDMVTGSEHAKSMGGSTIFLDAGEQMSVQDLLKGVAVASGNDAAVALAEHIGGSEEGFVAMMNQRAEQLGMADTHFVNCNGLDADGHYSSAYDIALMSRELLKHPDIHNFTTIWMDSLRGGQFTLSNTNKLIRFYEGATGLKTGSTSQAQFCVSATAKRNNMHLIAVIMAAPTSTDRVSDASKLLNYGFANYGIKQVVTAGEQMGEVTLQKGVKPTTQVVAKEGFDFLAKKTDTSEVEKRINLETTQRAPVKQGDTAGSVDFFVNGEQIGSTPLVYSETVPKITVGEVYMDLIRRWVGERPGRPRTTFRLQIETITQPAALEAEPAPAQ